MKRSGQIVLRHDPRNVETALEALAEDVRAMAASTPNGRFFTRNHFTMPAIDEEAFRLAVTGCVRAPLSLALDDLRRMPSRTLTVTLECAGNGRRLSDPAVAGEPWGLGAVGTAAWTGVPLADVLAAAGVRDTAVEALFRGADSGRVDAAGGAVVRFERSLPIAEARAAAETGPLLAYAMNGAPLPPERGHPLRLVAPGWYGMASVKWLTEITLLDQAFDGAFQGTLYWYEWTRDGAIVREPVTRQQVRALVLEPAADAAIARGPIVVRGVAWSGVAPITRVDVCLDAADDVDEGGTTEGGCWIAAQLQAADGTFAWTPWAVTLDAARLAPGVTRARLRARATDAAGRVQPLRAEWNRGGYGGNSIQQVRLRID